jgi:hypothetical protein
MKRIVLIILSWLALLTTAQADQPIVDQERQKTHIVSRMYQATYGVQKQCNQSASLNTAIEQVHHAYPELMRLIESSPYLPQAKAEFNSLWSTSGEQAGIKECQEIENMLRQLLDVSHGGRQAVNDMVQALKGNSPSPSIEAWPPDSSGPKLPFIIHWNVSKNGSSATEEFLVTEYRLYKFNIVFRYADRQRGAEEYKKLKQFTGNGSYIRVTKESAGTAHPVIAPEYSQQELDFLKNGGTFVGGAYFNNRTLKSNERIHESPPNTVMELSSSGAGVTIPIHIKIELVDDAGGTKLFTENIFDTKGITGGGSYGFVRTIANVGLRPDKYRVSVKTTKETAMPEGVETLLNVTWDPRFGMLKDTK